MPHAFDDVTSRPESSSFQSNSHLFEEGNSRSNLPSRFDDKSLDSIFNDFENKLMRDLFPDVSVGEPSMDKSLQSAEMELIRIIEVIELMRLMQMLEQRFGAGNGGSGEDGEGGSSESGGNQGSSDGGGESPASGVDKPPSEGGSSDTPHEVPSDNPPTNVPKGDGKTPTSAEDALSRAPIPDLPQDAIDVTKFGAKGDGSTDDTKAIQRAVDACPPGGTVHIPKGDYMINAAENGIVMKSGVTLQMDEGTVLHAIPNHEKSGCIIDVKDVKDVNIYGGKLEGERFQHTPNNNGECMNGIYVIKSENVNIVGVTSNNNFGDGFDVTHSSKNVRIINCVADGNRRDGISIEGVSGMEVSGCVLTNSGGNDSIDTDWPNALQLPMTGIDVEPSPNETVEGVVISNNLIAKNGTAADHPGDSNAFGIRLTGGFEGSHHTGTKVINNTIIDNASGQIGTWTGDHTVSGNIIRGPNPDVVYHGSADGDNTILNG